MNNIHLNNTIYRYYPFVSIQYWKLTHNFQGLAGLERGYTYAENAKSFDGSSRTGAPPNLRV